MGKLLTILFFLITSAAFAQQLPSEFNHLIGASKSDVKIYMANKEAYQLFADTVLLDMGETLWYDLKEVTDDSVIKNRILNFVFFFEKGYCNGVRFVILGSDKVIPLMESLDRTYRRIGVNLWVDEKVSIGVRIIQLPIYNPDGSNAGFFRIDMGTVDIFKN